MSKRNEETLAGLAEKIVAENGLLDRRTLLRGGLFSVGVVGAQAADITGADAPDWMKTPGRSFSAYGIPSKWQARVQRTFSGAPAPAATGTSRTPIHLMEGTITPNGLHFERH